MAPASFFARGASIALTSSIEARPPDAMTGTEMRSASAIVASRLRPFRRPSRAMSVQMMAATPASSNRCAISSAVTCEVSAQPSTATLPSRASSPTATRPGNFLAAPFTNSGSRTAAVPMITRATPLASQASTVFKSRMPPPSCTGMVTAFSIASTACAFIGLPAKAPSRSTTCRYSNPCAANACAFAEGSSLNTVARAISPCSRRTHWPFFRSMAGNRIIERFLARAPLNSAPPTKWRGGGGGGGGAAHSHRECGRTPRPAAFGVAPPHRSQGLAGGGKKVRPPGKTSRLPFQEVRDQGQPEALALLRVKLGADRGVLADDCCHRPAVICACQNVRLVGGVEVVGVHEIGVTAFWAERETLEHRMLPDHVERVPAHMGDLQILLARRNFFDVARNPIKTVGGDVLLAARGHQLHADADAEERPRLVAHRFRHRLEHAVQRVEAPAAIGKGADAGQHDAVGAKHHFRIAGHYNLFRHVHAPRRALEGFGGGVQIAGAVIDDGYAHLEAPGSGNNPMIALCGSGGGFENG